MAWLILCETSELAVESARAAQTIGLSVEPLITDRWFQDARKELSRNNAIAIALVQPPSIEQAVELSHVARSNKLDVAIAILERSAHNDRFLDVCSDLGIIGVTEISPLSGPPRPSMPRTEAKESHPSLLTTGSME